MHLAAGLVALVVGHGRLTCPAARNAVSAVTHGTYNGILRPGSIDAVKGLIGSAVNSPYEGVNYPVRGPCGTSLDPNTGTPDPNFKWFPTGQTGRGFVGGDKNGNAAVLHAYENDENGMPARIMFEVTAQHIGFFEFSLCACTNPDSSGQCPTPALPVEGHDQGTLENMVPLTTFNAR